MSGSFNDHQEVFNGDYNNRYWKIHHYLLDIAPINQLFMTIKWSLFVVWWGPWDGNTSAEYSKPVPALAARTPPLLFVGLEPCHELVV